LLLKSGHVLLLEVLLVLVLLQLYLLRRVL
jgi:hypothetical protein